MTKKFFSIHNHSEYSILDGIPKMKDYAKYISENKDSFQQGLCITDHGTILGGVDQFNSAKKYGLKCIFGVELYVANDFPENKKPKRYHLVLVAKNRDGYEQINQVMNTCIKEKLIYSSTKDFVIANTTILRDIFQNNQGNVICTSACMQSYIFDDFSEDKLTEIIDIFGKDNVFIEYQTFLDPTMKQATINELGKKMSLKYDVKTIITSDAHTIQKKHLQYWKTLTAMSFRMTVKMFEEKFGKNQSFSNYFKKPEDFLEELRYADFKITEKDALLSFENTNEIFESIEEFTINREQKFVYCENSVEKFSKAIKQGWNDKIVNKVDNIEKYKERLKYEIDIIKKKGFIDYTLAVSEILKECEKSEIMVGPGRGCFTPLSKVLMADNMHKFICDIKKGDKVFSGNGNIKEVEHVFVYDINEDIIDVELEDGRIISCTLDHKILLLRNNEKIWVQAKDIIENDIIVEIKDII